MPVLKGTSEKSIPAAAKSARANNSDEITRALFSRESWGHAYTRLQLNKYISNGYLDLVVAGAHLLSMDAGCSTFPIMCPVL